LAINGLITIIGPCRFISGIKTSPSGFPEKVSPIPRGRGLTFSGKPSEEVFIPYIIIESEEIRNREGG